MADERRRKSLSRKAKKTKISRPEKDEEPQTCVICLENVLCRGKLGVCQHWFCFPCIFEWSKNTNTCPVCKMRFRCISKIHLVPGKSPVKKVWVNDVDQCMHLDDEDFIWADLESPISDDEDRADYEPSSHDDASDNTFYPGPVRLYSDGSADIDGSMSNDSDSDAYCDNSSDGFAATLSSEEEMSCSEIVSHSESENSWSPVFQKKPARIITVSDSDDSSDTETDDERRSKDTNKKCHGKKSSRNGFHRNRQKPRKSTNQEFEAELQRRIRHASHSKTNTKDKVSSSKKNNRSKENDGAERGDSSTNTKGQWLSTIGAHSQACSSKSTSNRSNIAQSRVSGRRQTTLTDSFKSSDEEISQNVTVESTPGETTFAQNGFSTLRRDSISARDKSSTSRNERIPARNNSSNSRDERISAGNKSSSTRNKTNFTRNESISTRNNFRSHQSASPKTRSQKKRLLAIEDDSDTFSSDELSIHPSPFLTSSARNKTNFARNESISTRSNSRSHQSAQPKTRSQKKRLLAIEDDSDTFSSDELSIQLSPLLRRPKGSESDSDSSVDSWNPNLVFSKKRKVSERLRKNRNSNELENKRRTRSSRVLREMQNFSQ